MPDAATGEVAPSRRWSDYFCAPTYVHFRLQTWMQRWKIGDSLLPHPLKQHQRIGCLFGIPFDYESGDGCPADAA